MSVSFDTQESIEKSIDESEAWERALSAMKASHPLVHVISNLVTLQDVVNAILAAGGTAIAADDPKETAEISTLSQALYLNIGMPSDRKLEAMLAAGHAANAKGIPVVLDPVGAGASAYRAKFLETLLKEVKVTCIRGNAAEMAVLAGASIVSKGVEAGEILDEVDAGKSNLKKFAANIGSILVVSGATDLVISPSGLVLESATGSEMARRITGSGCMLGGLLAAFLGACKVTDAEDSKTNDSEEKTLGPSAPQEVQTKTWDEQAALLHLVVKQYGIVQEVAARATYERGAGTGTYHALFLDEITGWSL